MPDPVPAKTLLGGPDDPKPADEPIVDPIEGDDAPLDLLKVDPEPSVLDGDDDPAAAEKEAAEKEAAEKEAADKEAYESMTAEEKAAFDKAAEEKAAADLADADIVVTLPEGIVINDEIMEEFKKHAKEMKLTSEQAQTIIDLQVKLAEKSNADFEAEKKQWLSEIESDKEYGKDNLAKSKELARRAMNTFASPALKQLLDDTGFGDHPELFKLMTNVGRAMGEADFLIGSGSLEGGEKETADVLFSDMKLANRQ